MAPARVVRVEMVVVALCAVVASGCGETTDDTPVQAAQTVDEGSWYVHQRWPHDGSPVESEHFVVYSDAAGVEARLELLEAAERGLEAVTDRMAVDPGTSFAAGDGAEKIDIYAYHGYEPANWGARAYPDGLIVWSPDHPLRQGRINGLEATLRHELVHVIQWRVAGVDGGEVPTWFLEGLPEAISGGTAGGAIRSRARLEQLTGRYGRIVPVSVHSYSQITGPETGERFYYPMFQLAVEYLTDSDGLGRSMSDSTAVLIDVAAGVPFDVAFADRMGIAPEVYAAEFFDRMAAYLPAHRSPVFSPVGFALFSLLVIGSILGLLRVNARGPLLTEGVPGSGSPRVSLGFVVEMTVAVVVTVGTFLGGTYLVGTAGILDNDANAPVRAGAYWLLAGFLVVAMTCLAWATRRWSQGSRAAFWVLPLVVASTLGSLALASAIV